MKLRPAISLLTLFLISISLWAQNTVEPPALKITGADSVLDDLSTFSVPNRLSVSNPSPATYRPGNDVSSPVLRRFVAPLYPNEALKMRLGGSVLLAVIVNEQGEISSVKVNHALGMGTDEEAVAAVRQWRFTPALKSGKPVKVFIPVELTFDKDSGRTGGAVLNWSGTASY